MSLGDVYQVLVDCPHCHTEAAVVQVMDPLHPACHLGVPAESRCRLCGHIVRAVAEEFAPRLPMASGRCPACQRPLSEAARGGDAPCPHCGYVPRTLEQHRPLDLTLEDSARRALERWAREEGEELGVFCLSNMGRRCDDVIALLRDGQPVPTTFDVIAYLFPAGSGGGAGAPQVPEIVEREPEPHVETVQEAAAHAVPEAMDPRTPARVLISVMLADGELRSGERQFIERFLEREGLGELSMADLRVWRPAELGVPPPPELRERLVEAAVHLAHLDREREGSEWKVILAFAADWGVPEPQLQAWDKQYDRRYSTAMSRLWRSLSRMVRVH